MAGDRLRYISKGLVPGLDVIEADPACIDRLLEKQSLLAERAELREALAKIPKVPMTFDEVLASHRASYDAALLRYSEGKLAKYASENLTNADPFKRLERMSFFTVAFPPWEAYEHALRCLPAEAFGVVTETEKSKEAKKIEKRIAAIDAKISEISCPPFLKLTSSGAMGDVRAEFMQHWVRLQRTCSEPCDPRGFALRGAESWVSDAYRKLGIGSEVAKTSTAMLAAERD